MSGRRWGQIDGSRIRGGGAGGLIATGWGLPERGGGIDRRTDGRRERPILLKLCTLSMTRRTLTGKEKLLKAEPADKSHGRHSPTHLHSALCSSFQLFFGIFISLRLDPDTHTRARVYTHAERQAHLNFLLQGHAVKEDKVVSMFCSSYLCWRRHVAWAPC